jgi:hypothetical protein
VIQRTSKGCWVVQALRLWAKYRPQLGQSHRQQSRLLPRAKKTCAEGRLRVQIRCTNEWKLTFR